MLTTLVSTAWRATAFITRYMSTLGWAESLLTAFESVFSTVMEVSLSACRALWGRLIAN